MTHVYGESDEALESIRAAMDRYEADRPGAVATIRRSYPTKIRILVIDPSLEEVDPFERVDVVLKYLEPVPDEFASQVLKVFPLAPSQRYIEQEFYEPPFAD